MLTKVLAVYTKTAVPNVPGGIGARLLAEKLDVPKTLPTKIGRTNDAIRLLGPRFDTTHINMSRGGQAPAKSAWDLRRDAWPT